MRSLWLLSLIPSAFLFSTPVGNPALPALLQEGIWIPDTAWSNPQLGIGGDYLIQKRLRACHQSRSIGLSDASLWGGAETFSLAWSIREKFHIQAFLGTGQFHWQWRQIGHNTSGLAQGGLVWGGDSKLIILEMKDTVLAVDAQAGGWDWMDGPASTNATPLTAQPTSTLRYWQIGVAMTQQISLFAPYLGIATHQMRLQISHLPTGNGKMHALHSLGPFIGCSIGNGSKFLVNLEYRGWFEEGVSLTAHMRF
jgi:hypothetical protein